MKGVVRGKLEILIGVSLFPVDAQLNKKGKQTLNKDEGAYKLHNIYGQLILTKTTPMSYKGAVMSGLGCQSDEAARVTVKRH